MITATDIAPFAGTVGSSPVGWAIKEAIKIPAVIVGMFISALQYLEYQRILSIDSDTLSRHPKM